MDQINSFIYYDNISDTIHWLDKNTSVKFNVKLSRKDEDGNRVHFHNEYKYESQYTNTQYGYSIKRQYDSYLTIENKNNNVYIQIRMQNIILLRLVLADVVKILMNDKKYWTYIDKRLATKGPIKPITYNGLPMNKWLSFEPIPIVFEDESKKGVRITLSDKEKYIDVSMDAFLAFTYIIDSIDMLSLAATMINYIPNHEVYNVNSSFIQPIEKETKPIRTATEVPKVTGKGRRIPGTQLSLDDMK